MNPAVDCVFGIAAERDGIDQPPSPVIDDEISRACIRLLNL